VKYEIYGFLYLGEAMDGSLHIMSTYNLQVRSAASFRNANPQHP